MTASFNPFGTWAASAPTDRPAPPPGSAMDRFTGEYITDKDGNYIAEDALLLAWSQAQATAVAAVERERKLRAQVDAVFGDPEKLRGTQNIPLANGYKLKLERGINYKLGAKVERASAEVHEAAVRGVLSKIEQCVENGAAIAKALVKWRPELSETAYRAETLPQVVRDALDDVLTTTPATPKITIVPPKDAA